MSKYVCTLVLNVILKFKSLFDVLGFRIQYQKNKRIITISDSIKQLKNFRYTKFTLFSHF
jgi:hypothetical protein